MTPTLASRLGGALRDKAERARADGEPVELGSVCPRCSSSPDDTREVVVIGGGRP